MHPHAIKKGYFLYDTLECILRYEHEGPEFLAHGVFCLAVFGALVHIRCVHWCGAGFLMWELSTPFVHARWFLYKIGKDKTRLYAANAAAGFLVFFVCRVLWGPVVSVFYWHDSLKAFAVPELYATMPLAWMWFFRSWWVGLAMLDED